MTYTLGTVEGRGIRSVNYIYTESGVTLTVTLTDDTTTEFTIPKGDKGDTGDTGVSITGVELVSRTGLTDLYVIRFSDGTSTNFSVTNGRDAVVDSSMDSSSTNALENRVITNELVGIHSDLDTKFNEKDILQLLYDYGHVSDGTVSRITLVSDKDILSYADGDVATLTATVYDTNDNGVANQIVVFYKNGKVLDTGVTDANGEATYEYESEGAGDITFGASAGRFVIETYSIEDCWINNNSQYSSTTLLSLPIPTDSDLIAEFDLYRDIIGNCWLEIGADTDNNVFGGLTSGNGKHGVYVKQNGSYVSSDDSTTEIFPKYTSKKVIFKIENNTVSSTANNDSRSTTNNVISARNYQRIYCKDGAYLTNLKIKSL